MKANPNKNIINYSYDDEHIYDTEKRQVFNCIRVLSRADGRHRRSKGF